MDISDSGEEHELDAKEPALKSDSEALKFTDMLLEYSRYQTRDDLSLTINKINDLPSNKQALETEAATN